MLQISTDTWQLISLSFYMFLCSKNLGKCQSISAFRLHRALRLAAAHKLTLIKIVLAVNLVILEKDEMLQIFASSWQQMSLFFRINRHQTLRDMLEYLSF